MTLFRQLLIAILAATLLLYMGNVAVGLRNGKNLVENQMRIHAQDAATSIALSMTQVASENNVAGLKSILESVSDNGFYQRIYFRDIDDKLIIDKSFVGAAYIIPEWFVSLIALGSYEGIAEVSSGWTKLGTLVVVSHPGHAYKNLWHLALEQLAWFALVSTSVCLLLWPAISRLLRPLKELESQIDGICRQEFIELDSIPRTRELASLVLAMNRMSLQQQQLFNSQLELISKLRKETHTDQLTGLSNRVDFDARLNSYVDDELGRHPVVLMIFAVQNLHQINEVAGRVEGNSVLRSLADCLTKNLEGYDQAVIARRQGSEFSVFISDIQPDEADELGRTLFAEVEQLSWVGQSDQPLVIHMGFTYSNNASNGPELLSEADMVLRSFSQSEVSEWARFADIEDAPPPVLSMSVIDWGVFVQQAIGEREIQLNIQPIMRTTVSPNNGANDEELFAYKVLSSFPDKQGGPGFTARIVMPALERAGLAQAFDQLVLTELCSQWQGRTERLSVNICLNSLKSTKFHDWLTQFFIQYPAFAEQLTFELSERMLRLAEHDVRAFETVLTRHGAGLAIDGFGLSTFGFAYLGSLPLRYLKVDRSFCKNIHSDKDNQFYIKALVQLAETRLLPIIAEGVEAQTDWDTLDSLGISGAQGYLFGHPQVIHPATESTI